MACPLFQGRIPCDMDKKWSLFELTKWLLGDSQGDLEAGKKVAGALNRLEGKELQAQLKDFVSSATHGKKYNLFRDLIQEMKEREAKFDRTVSFVGYEVAAVWDPDGKDCKFCILGKLTYHWMFMGNIPHKFLEGVVKHCSTKEYTGALN
ncbi:unnamed protein product [Cylindrotheca closterium]|uniref:Uncharacterized protein n=1 Tax=Cylindrotheca closterium TaxID=2856 RepID=A0AAD2GCR5_9STRA|nr:unnamed protein product [Cylindrotheca closterium]